LRRSELKGEQHSLVLVGDSDVLVAKDVVYLASRSEVPSGTFKRFRMLPQRNRRIGSGLFQRVTGRKARRHAP